MTPIAASGRGLTIAVVGATGLVGRELLRTLEERRFPVGRLLPFSSGRAGARVRFRGRVLPAPAASLRTLATADLVFLVSSDEVSRRWSPLLARRGVWVIDDSAAFRLDPAVPLVIPEVNAHALSPRKRLIAGPNCTLTGAAVACRPIVHSAGATALRIASYQAVSGAGKAALDEFLGQVRGHGLPASWESLPVRLAPRAARALPRPIALNVFPQVGSFDENGHSSEEWKVARELRKIWDMPSLAVSVTAVRVPVLRGHSLAVWIQTRRALSPARAARLLSRAPGVRLWPGGSYPTPLDAHGTWPVHVGRVRAGAAPRELALWIVTDNLLKGAALNSVQIAEELRHRGWLASRVPA